jgi:hypothetical protein
VNNDAYRIKMRKPVALIPFFIDRFLFTGIAKPFRSTGFRLNAKGNGKMAA